MAFTYEQIIRLKDPYKTFSEGAVLAENAKVLNALSDKEKHTLATEIIKSCPEVKAYRRQIEALNHPLSSEGTFYSVITQALEVKQRLLALIDPRNKSPWLLTGKDANQGLFRRFSELTKDVLEHNERALAERFALHASKESQDQIAAQLKLLSPEFDQTNLFKMITEFKENSVRNNVAQNPNTLFSGSSTSSQVNQRNEDSNSLMQHPTQ